MERRKKSDESSFAGFLDSYSRGNIAFQSKLVDTYAYDINKLSELIQNVVMQIEALHIDTADVRGIINHLQNSLEALKTIKDSPMENLLIFANEMEMAILNFQVVSGILSEGVRLAPVKKSLNIVIYNFLTFAKKIGGNNLIEKAISIAEKF